MNSLGKKEILLIVSSLLLFLSTVSDKAFAERPFLLTERAIPLERGNYQLETGLVLNRFSSDTRDANLLVDIRYGLIQNLELDILLPYLFREEDGEHENQIGDLLLRAKVRFLKGREANPLSIAGQLFIKVPSAGRDRFFGTTGEPDLGIVAIASKEFTPVTAHINFGYIFIGNPPLGDLPDQILYALGLELQTIEDPLSLIGEISGSTEIGNSASKGILTLLGGVNYKFERAVSADASVGFGLTDDSPDYLVQFGFTYLFE
ncbi:MAG: transporter [Candidatus Manganitrophus sp. SA1]|nr:transporter [Candidatus Manganitrophus morganii]